MSQFCLLAQFYQKYEKNLMLIQNIYTSVRKQTMVIKVLKVY